MLKKTPKRNKNMKIIIRQEWDKIHQDFKGVSPDGTHSVLELDPKTGATVSTPVQVADHKKLYQELRDAWTGSGNKRLGYSFRNWLECMADNDRGTLQEAAKAFTRIAPRPERPNKRVKLETLGNSVAVFFDGHEVWRINCLSPDDALSYAATVRVLFYTKYHPKNRLGKDSILVRHATGAAWVDEDKTERQVLLQQRDPLL